MPRDLFGDVISPPPSISRRKWYTVPLSLIAHIALIVPLVLVPVLAHDMLPHVRKYVVLVADGVLPSEPPIAPRPAAASRETRPTANPHAAPTNAPEHIAPEPSLEVLEGTIETGVPGNEVVIAEAPPPPPLPPPTVGLVRVGGEILPPVKIRDRAPVYPPIAQAARVQGTVLLEATIGAKGTVENVRVLRSIPLLDQAAIDAVQQWEYSPTQLNGVPVAVLMTVTVTFTLNR